TIILVFKSTRPRSIENIPCVEAVGQHTGHGLVAKCIVAPDGHAALFAGVIDSGAQRPIVVALRGNARPQTYGLHQLLDVEKHDVTVALAPSFEVMAMLFAVVE